MKSLICRCTSNITNRHATDMCLLMFFFVTTQLPILIIFRFSKKFFVTPYTQCVVYSWKKHGHLEVKIKLSSCRFLTHVKLITYLKSPSPHCIIEHGSKNTRKLECCSTIRFTAVDCMNHIFKCKQHSVIQYVWQSVACIFEVGPLCKP